MSTAAMSSNLQELVQNELVWDPQVTAPTIGVTSKDGAVTLTGYVPSYTEKIAAERAALRVQGTRAVANDIIVRLDSERIDPDIAKDASEALKFNLSVPKTVKAVVHNGYVTLEGTCEWYYQREAAESAVAHLRGVKGVTNALTVKPRASASVVKSHIEDALKRSAEIDARHVNVAATGNTVVLSGRVKSYAERMEAARAAWASPGVMGVDNRIEVTP